MRHQRLTPSNCARPVIALILREIATSRSEGGLGYFWALLEPVLTIILLTGLISFVPISPPLGDSFALYYASGLLPLIIFTSIVAKSGQAESFSKPLFSLGPVTVFHSLLARFTLSALTHLLVVLIGCAYFARETDLFRHGVAILQALGSLFLLSFGAATLACWLGSTLRFWPRVWAITSRPLFLLSGVFLLVDEVPDLQQQALLWNPMTHVIMFLRTAMYPAYTTDLYSIFYIFVVSGCLAVTGLIGLSCKGYDYGNR